MFWRERRCWIFDLDGTLTVAVHDFDAIRRELSLPQGKPILEALAELPAPERLPRMSRLDALERELAQRARPAEGAESLLESLRSRGARLGIVTRNGYEIALDTLRAARLERFFDPAHVIGREAAPPKPSPDGVRMLLDDWRAQSSEAVMVGDYLFDLIAGRAAGAATIHVDTTGTFRWPEHADACIRSLNELLR